MEKVKKEKKKRRKSPSVKSPLVRRYSAGGVVFKKTKKEGVLWLLVRPKATDRWQFPKGEIDKGETSEEAAAREVAEEAGVEAKVLRKIGNQSYFYYLEGKKIFQQVVFYLMEHVGESSVGFDKTEISGVRTLSYKKAFTNLTFENDKKLLEKAKEVVKSGLQENLL